MNLIELAERCEQATGPDRELDAAIQRALGDGSGEHWFTDCFGNHVTDAIAPQVTASLDAAMTLAGDWGFDVRRAVGGVGIVEVYPEGFCQPSHRGRAQSPALALCAAALRARASQGQQS